MKDRVPKMEYVFCDTSKGLKETYKYLANYEAYLGNPIVRLNPEGDFDHWLERWCTRMLKLKPFEKCCAEGEIVNYVGIRADENREGYISTKPNIKSVFPFKEDGITQPDVFRILEESIGNPRVLQVVDAVGLLLLFFPAQERVDGAFGARSCSRRRRSTRRSTRGNATRGRKTRVWKNWPKPERLVHIRSKAGSLDKERTGTNLMQILAVEEEELDTRIGRARFVRFRGGP